MIYALFTVYVPVIGGMVKKIGFLCHLIIMLYTKHLLNKNNKKSLINCVEPGIGQPPVTVDSIAEMLEKIKHTKYSIGYIDRRVDDEDIYFFDAR